LNFTAPTTGKLNIIKDGAGTQVLSGVSEYTGTTVISGGNLSISATGTINTTASISIDGAGANLNYTSTTALTAPVTFGAGGGKLSGIGTISPAAGVTAGANATVAPGNSPGSLTFTTGLTFNTGSTYLWNNEEGNTSGSVGTDFSSIIRAAAGTMTINDGTLSLLFNGTTDFTSGMWATSHTWDIISGGSVTGSFSNIVISGSSLGLANAANTLSEGTFSNAVSGGDLILTWTPSSPVPEPASLMLLSLGAAALLRRRRTN
jgi:autotransporter-associated beta strand protein